MSRPFRSLSIKQLKDYTYKAAGLKATGAAAHGVATNGQVLAAPFGSRGTVALFALDKSKNKPPLQLQTSASDVLDLAFAPHAPADASEEHSLLIVGPEALTVWRVQAPGADGTPAAAPAAAVTVTGLAGTIACARYHPTVADVVAVGSQAGLSVVSVAAEAPPEGRLLKHFALKGFGKDVVFVEWARDGSRLVAIGKNGSVYSLDPRVAAPDVLETGAVALLTLKNPHFAFFTGSGAPGAASGLVLGGLGAARKPKLVAADAVTLAEERSEELLTSSGQLLALLDPDTAVLTVFARGGQSLFHYDVTRADAAAGAAAQSLALLVQTPVATTAGGAKGLAATPKRALALLDAEVARVLAHTGESVETYSLSVLRKSREFHTDLFPPSAARTPALALDAWLAGADAAPVLESLAVYAGGVVASPSPIASPSSSSSPSASFSAPSAAGVPEECKSSESPTSSTSPSSFSSSSFSSSSSSASSTAPAASAAATPALPADSAKRSNLLSKLARTPFLHTAGVEPGHNKDLISHDLRPAPPLALGRSLVANAKYWALPWNVSGGSAVYVRHHSTVGRVPIPQKCRLVRAHATPLLGLDLSALEPQRLATAGEDGLVRVFALPAESAWPAGTELPADLVDAELEVPVGGRIGVLRWHPHVAGVLLVATYAPGVGDRLFLLDARLGPDAPAFGSAAARVTELTGAGSGLAFSDRVLDVDTSPALNEAAVTTRDGLVHVLALPSGRPLRTLRPPQKNKDLQARYLDANHLLTWGFATGTDRSVSLYARDGAGGDTLLKTLSLPNTHPVLGHLDPVSGLLVIAGVGSAQFQVVHATTQAPHLDLLSTWTSKSDVLCTAFLPKVAVNVREVEVLRCVKLSKGNELFPVKWVVPRKRPELFQADLYPGGAPQLVSAVPPGAWLAGQFEAAGATVPHTSLQPPDMVSSGTAEPEALTDRQKLALAERERAAAAPQRGFLGHTSQAETVGFFQAKLSQMPANSGRFDAATVDRDDVSDSEW